MIFTKDSGDLNGLFNYFYKKKQNKLYDLFNVASIGYYYQNGWSDASILINPSISSLEKKIIGVLPSIRTHFFKFLFLKALLCLALTL